MALNDIGIGVAYGDSPFLGNIPPAGQENGLLFQDGGLKNPANALPNGEVPFLFLPPQACSAIANFIPVTFNTDINLYIWNTTDPSYQRIMSSPAYLAFMFGSGSPTNITISVPFILLSLNLSSPLADQPTEYFPCSPFTPNPSDFLQLYHLGRAFLQGAFLGQSRDPDTSVNTWIAQAPGPDMPSSNVLPIHGKVLQPLPHPPLWNDTWKSVLKPLGQATAVNDTPIPIVTTPTSGGIAAAPVGSTTPTGLSPGAKAGIGIGVAVGLILLAILVFVVFWRYRRKPRPEPSRPPSIPEKDSVPIGITKTPLAEAEGRFQRPGRQELPGDLGHRYELSAE